MGFNSGLKGLSIFHIVSQWSKISAQSKFANTSSIAIRQIDTFSVAPTGTSLGYLWMILTQHIRAWGGEWNLDRQVVIHKSSVTEGETAKSEFYIYVLERPQYQKKRSSWFLLHNNATVHSAMRVTHTYWQSQWSAIPLIHMTSHQLTFSVP
jgi:hypothetical protein